MQLRHVSPMVDLLDAGQQTHEITRSVPKWAGLIIRGEIRSAYKISYQIDKQSPVVRTPQSIRVRTGHVG